MPTLRLIASACVAFAIAAPAAAGELRRPDKVSFYFAAHEDDWQLFMNPSAFQDVAADARKTVFIHVTAGDAGLGTGRGGRKHPLYLARENGAETAIRFMADGDEPPAERAISTAVFNGHPIYRVGYRDTVSYFLRVPDGGPNGDGYAATGFQSLLRLSNGANRELGAVNGSTIYHGWTDLVATLQAIVAHERGGAATIQINVAEPDPRINPSDHADHTMTTKAALDAVKDQSCVRRAYYVDYASADLPENLSAHERDVASSVFAVTLAGVRALDHRTFWRHYDQSFVGRNYFRVEELPADCGQPMQMAIARHR